MTSDYSSFYGARRAATYAHDYSRFEASEHPRYADLQAFIERYDLRDKRCLEIGSSGGFFQDMVDDYYGTDIAEELSEFYHKPYRVATGSRYPFDDGMFDAIWTIAVYEHIPDLQTAMLELVRLLKPGGVLLFAPAWQCRPWAAEGYAVRPYRDFGLRGKLIKASIPIRDSVLWRLLSIVPKRILRHCMFLLGHRFESLRYSKLEANYGVFWTSDSDACNHIDPHDAMLWFLSHGFGCLSHPTNLCMLLVRSGSLVFRKRPDASSGRAHTELRGEG